MTGNSPDHPPPAPHLHCHRTSHTNSTDSSQTCPSQALLPCSKHPLGKTKSTSAFTNPRLQLHVLHRTGPSCSHPRPSCHSGGLMVASLLHHLITPHGSNFTSRHNSAPPGQPRLQWSSHAYKCLWHLSHHYPLHRDNSLRVHCDCSAADGGETMLKDLHCRYADTLQRSGSTITVSNM